MREYSATVGATDGNIIAAIITTQTPRNQPNAPREVQGPSSMPCIWPAVHHQPTTYPDGGEGRTETAAADRPGRLGGHQVRRPTRRPTWTAPSFRRTGCR